MTRMSMWLVLFGCVMLGSCARIYPPAAFVDRVAPIYPDARPQNCNVALLTDAPTEPYEIFARIACYAGSAEMSERMLELIKANACEIGADALVVSPLQHGAHSNTDSIYPDWVVAGEGGGDHSVSRASRASVPPRARARGGAADLPGRRRTP